MLMVDRVVDISSTGGSDGKGRIFTHHTLTYIRVTH